MEMRIKLNIIHKISNTLVIWTTDAVHHFSEWYTIKMSAEYCNDASYDLLYRKDLRPSRTSLFPCLRFTWPKPIVSVMKSLPANISREFQLQWRSIEGLNASQCMNGIWMIEDQFTFIIIKGISSSKRHSPLRERSDKFWRTLRNIAYCLLTL